MLAVPGAGLTNERIEFTRGASEVIHMLIEWLLTRAQKTQIQERASERTCQAVELSEETCGAQPTESNEQMNGHHEQDHLVRECSSDYNVDNQHSKTYLRCGCGYDNQVDSPLSGKAKSGIVRFKCASCGRELQYNQPTRITRTRKGILGFLFGRFQ